MIFVIFGDLHNCVIPSTFLVLSQLMDTSFYIFGFIIIA